MILWMTVNTTVFELRHFEMLGGFSTNAVDLPILEEPVSKVTFA